MPQVAPYSGDMLAMVARSASGRSCKPGPKYSTNLPTTPCLRSISVIVSTKSVAVAPSRSLPVSLLRLREELAWELVDPTSQLLLRFHQRPSPGHPGH